MDSGNKSTGSYDPLPNNAQIIELLRRRAKERSSSLRWNTNTLILAYSILAVTIILALREVNIALIASVAVLGLGIIWGFSYVQAKRAERELTKDEFRIYMELLANQPPKPLTVDEQRSDKEDESPLTERELQVLKLIAEGKSNKETASMLHISDQTVKNHISHIFAKLDVGDRTSAVLFAMSRGWIKTSEYEHSKTALDKNH